MDIKTEFSTDIAKKIFGNKENASKFLVELAVIKNLVLPFKKISKGINKDKKVLKLTTKELWDKIVTYWDFSNGESIIRELFKETKKYESGKDSYSTMEVLINEWTNLSLGDISWPFSQGDFDGFVQRLNSENTTGSYKDEKVKQAAVKYRRIKEINTVRNDFLETLIFDKNENILPTLNHRKGVDFFINGVSFDQKVSRSPTKEFKKYYGENWKEEAIKNPSKVAEYLYMYQDEGRFGADSRLLVVYLDEDVSISKISEIIQNIDLNNPIEINFEYIHNKNKPNELKKFTK